MESEVLDFAKLFELYSWKEIKNCPGRYVLNNQILIQIFTSEICRDAIHIGKFTDGGLLSYGKSDGTYVHTLNNSSGLTRKMNHLNIHFDNETIR
ncbi:unnamed protein product [Adineta ricciae]|uniref:Uncharacterized protein n=1 Tax=Adineta ricciae TaxID=249248 RepID=A0A814H4I5_ADIRI|nr:unnamed protein product [Adineta ricciae]